jgi:hypothetical protein
MSAEKLFDLEHFPYQPLAARKGGIFPYGVKYHLVVQDNTQEGIFDVDPAAVVLDKSQFPEFVHEKIDARPRCANHLSQHLLGYFGKCFLKFARRSEAREQEQSARQSFLAGVEELVYQVLFDSDVSRQHVSDEAVGKLVFPVKHSNHFAFLNDEHSRGCNCCRV